MPFNVAERVAVLIGEVGRIESESEDIYLSLGRLFPRLVAEMRKSSETAQASLDGFSSLKEGARGAASRGASAGVEPAGGAPGAGGGLDGMSAFAEESSAYFRRIHERDSAFLARINESIERLSSLEELIGRVRLDSEEMEIISLNAMTVALKSGNAGKAFSVITDELKRLSSRTIALTEEITARGRALLEYFSRLRDSLGELDSFQAAFFADLDKALSQGYSELEGDVRSALEVFGGLLADAQSVREPVQNIMQGIQLQDIFRQSLQHVSISLEEARKSAGEASAMGSGSEASAALAEELAFVAAVAELSGSLLEEIVGQLDSAAGEFAKEIEAVSRLIEEVEGRRAAFIGDPERVQEGSVDASRFSAGSGRYLALKKDVIGTARRLSEQVRVLDESFKGLAGLLARFQNIVVASRIEVAKNRTLAGVTTTVQGMIELTERLGADVGGAMATTKDFIKVASAAIAEYSGGEEAGRRSAREDSKAGTAEGDRLQATLRSVEAGIESLDGSRVAVARAVGDFRLYTPEFIALIAEARGALERLRGLSAELKRAQADLALLKSTVDEEAGPDAPRGAIRSDRLKSMIERFTIFTHKRTAGQIGNFDVEAGVEAGDITLF